MQTHKAGWVRLVRPYFSVNFHQALVDDLFDFIIGKSVLQPVAQKHSQWEALTQPVRTTAWTRCLPSRRQNKH